MLPTIGAPEATVDKPDDDARAAERLLRVTSAASAARARITATESAMEKCQLRLDNLSLRLEEQRAIADRLDRRVAEAKRGVGPPSDSSHEESHHGDSMDGDDEEDELPDELGDLDPPVSGAAPAMLPAYLDLACSGAAASCRTADSVGPAKTRTPRAIRKAGKR